MKKIFVLLGFIALLILLVSFNIKNKSTIKMNNENTTNKVESSSSTATTTGPAILFKMTSPTSGSEWTIGSNQKVSWNLSGLPEGKYNIVIFLKDTSENGISGDIATILAANGSGEISYKVGSVLVGGDALNPVKVGKHEIHLRLYKPYVNTNSQNGGAVGYGEFIVGKNLATVTVK